MNVGVIVGTYSSIFVAAPILIWLNRRFFKPEGKGMKQHPGKSNADRKAPV
jgi:preprotein translocase subunit SecF